MSRKLFFIETCVNQDADAPWVKFIRQPLKTWNTDEFVWRAGFYF